jgi:hypothetical protein
MSGAMGAVANPKVAIAKVTLCATVKAVTVLSSIPRPLTITSSLSANNKWSTPNP